MTLLAALSNSLHGQEVEPSKPQVPAKNATDDGAAPPAKLANGDVKKKADDASPDQVALPEDAKAALTNIGKKVPNANAEGKPNGIAKLPGLTPLSDKFGLWVDRNRKWVVVDGKISLSRGVLEMFACPRGSKEHESVISVDCPSRFVHAALLVVGAKPGRPVQFDPAYLPANGQVIDVYILWIDKDGKKQSAKAQEWIRNTKTKKQMKHSFVFAGSGFWREMIDGKPFEHYLADAGDLICVSNFPSATLDLPIKSSKENSSLLYEAFPGRIPPRGTQVRLVLIPLEK